jgi:hypothetical protein
MDQNRGYLRQEPGFCLVDLPPGTSDAALTTPQSLASLVVRKAVHMAQLPINPLLTVLCDAGKAEAVTLPELPDLLKAFHKAMPVSISVQQNH